MKIISTIKETMADGPGLRYSIYVSGCDHKCNGCHNKKTWDKNLGEKLTLEKIKTIKKEIISNTMLDGVTISGGDPFLDSNVIGLYTLLKELRNITNSIWVYTGYTIEEILEHRITSILCLSLIDVLVDGEFKKDLISDNLLYRGSSNQRLIRTKDFFLKNNFNLENLNNFIIRK